jgi:uncharacterized membrane protein (DUF373 family)
MAGGIAWVRRFEGVIIAVLIVLLALVIALSTLDLCWQILRHLLAPPRLVVAVSDLLDLLAFFLLVVIGLELLETVKAYLSDRTVHVETVLEVALIAVARKVIILDLKEYSALTLLGIAALVLSLAAASYLERRSRRRTPAAAGGRVS